MCGIVGAVAERDVTPILLEGLKRLEYRGYDSAGIAVFTDDNTIARHRVKGKVEALRGLVNAKSMVGSTGLAHTRWATHGMPSEMNAHPHMSSDEIALVHNGIIENHAQLRKQLIAQGYDFISATDTEVVAHLFHHQLLTQKDSIAALRETISKLEGAFSLGIIDKSKPGRMLAVRCGSPLVIGKGIGENFIASDSLALLPVTQEFIYLDEGDMADICRDEVIIYNAAGKQVKRKVHRSNINVNVANRGDYQHFMQKEIFEQPTAIAATMEGRINNHGLLQGIFGAKSEVLLAKTKRVVIIACGTSYHAGLIARYWLEQYAKMPCTVEVASEYRYRQTVIEPNTLFVTISQSGETADTLAALRLAKQQRYLGSLAICNVPESSLVRESDLVFMTRAGVEIGVASTKAFTTQLTALFMLTLTLGNYNGLDIKTQTHLVKQLNSVPRIVEKTLGTEKTIIQLAKTFASIQNTLFLGRGLHYPVALEGSLKLKEISYIHAEAYPAGELKHGPLALVDETMPVIAVAPNDALLDKLKSNLHEVRARNGRLIVFAEHSIDMEQDDGINIISMPRVDAAIAPIIYTIPLQLLAYHVALIKGTDVDQPRNLAKSVTVE